MQILSEINKPYSIDSSTDPLSISHFWIFNALMLDFKLQEFKFLQEITGQTITLEVQDTQVPIPISWNILVVDRETYTIESIPITQCASFNQDVFLFSPHDGKLKTIKPKVLGFSEQNTCIVPEVPKTTALICPTHLDYIHGKLINYGIVIGPHDLYKWIKNKTVGDILT
jgi:hypothetical protein